MRVAPSEALSRLPHDAAFGRIIDGDFVVVLPSPDVTGIPGRGPTVHTAPSGLAPLTAERAPPAFSQNGGIGFWGVGVVVISAAFWVSGGYSLVDGKPQQRSGAIRPSTLDAEQGVATRAQAIGAHAQVQYRGAEVEAVPPAAFRVLTREGREIDYRVISADKPLPAGSGRVFPTRIVAAPNEAASVRAIFIP